jgi:DNA-binding winged helix-turn-helix (wHTH) protein
MNARVVVLASGELHDRLIAGRKGSFEVVGGADALRGGAGRIGMAPLIVIHVTQSDRAVFQDVLDRVNCALHDSDDVAPVVLGTITVDFGRRQVCSPHGSSLHLTAQEFELLKYLAARRDQVVTRDELLREVWKYPDTPLTRSVDNAVSRLRKKIEPCPQAPRFIHTVHRDGYCLTPTRTRDAALQPEVALGRADGAA